jgi:hypothetical protein
MLFLKNLMKTKTGSILISIILGLGLATLFRKKCLGEDCIDFKSPSLDDIKEKNYKYGNTCFKYDVSSIKCNKKKKNIRFA